MQSKKKILQKVQNFLVREAWGSNPEPIKSPTRCQRLAIAATFEE